MITYIDIFQKKLCLNFQIREFDHSEKGLQN